jgi:glycosyl-4,4'-diaponeurosporenoate acyltransferase
MWGGPALVAVDVVAWGLVHAGTGWYVHRLPLDRLDHDNWLWRGRAWERDGRVYERLAIRRWKDRLPDAGDLFPGGVSKRRLPSTGAAGLARFAAETRRAELGHVLAAVAGPLFLLWNPLPVAVVMVAYGLVVNLPFVAIQRYNRLRITRLERLAATAGRRSSSDPSLGPSTGPPPADRTGGSPPPLPGRPAT